MLQLPLVLLLDSDSDANATATAAAVATATAPAIATATILLLLLLLLLAATATATATLPQLRFIVTTAILSRSQTSRGVGYNEVWLKEQLLFFHQKPALRSHTACIAYAPK